VCSEYEKEKSVTDLPSTVFPAFFFLLELSDSFGKQSLCAMACSSTKYARGMEEVLALGLHVASTNTIGTRAPLTGAGVGGVGNG